MHHGRLHWSWYSWHSFKDNFGSLAIWIIHRDILQQKIDLTPSIKAFHWRHKGFVNYIWFPRWCIHVSMLQRFYGLRFIYNKKIQQWVSKCSANSNCLDASIKRVWQLKVCVEKALCVYSRHRLSQNTLSQSTYQNKTFTILNTHHNWCTQGLHNAPNTYQYKKNDRRNSGGTLRQKETKRRQTES